MMGCVGFGMDFGVDFGRVLGGFRGSKCCENETTLKCHFEK